MITPVLALLLLPLLSLPLVNPNSSEAPWQAEFRGAERDAREQRAAGEYQKARDRLFAYAADWSTRLEKGPIPCPGTQAACAAAVEDLIARASSKAAEFGVLADLKQRVRDGDAAAARALATRLLGESQRRWTSRREKRELFRALVEHDARVRGFVTTYFPAGVEIRLEPGFGLTGPGYLTTGLERGGAELGLAVDRNASGASTLVVRAEIEENDTSREDIFYNTSMKSFSIGATVDLVARDGRVLASAVESGGALGISVKHAAKDGLNRLSRALLEALVDDILFRVYRDEL